MPTHKEVYEGHAAQYEALVSREDHEGNILTTVESIGPIANQDVIDLGAGTGRLAGLLAPQARSMLAFDLSPHMLTVARDKLRGADSPRRWLAAAADHRFLPLAARTADVLVSGWSVSYVAIWYPETWRAEAAAWLAEAARVLRKGGRVILFESLGTGNEQPVRLAHLENFYDWLDEQKFSKTWIRTDYSFETEEIADYLAGFFFGEEMKSKIKRGKSITLPECTGVWWRTL